MGARSYVPQLGRFLQPDPIPGGSANAYTYTFGDPVNTSDPSGALTGGPSQSLINGMAQMSEEGVAEQAAENAAARAEAERKAAAAAAAAGPQFTEAKWEEEYAMGGASLDEINASNGIVPGGGMEGEGGGVGGCPGTMACTAMRHSTSDPNASTQCVSQATGIVYKGPYRDCARGTVPVGTPHNNPSHPRGPLESGNVDCPEGTYFGAGAFTGDAHCIPEGDPGQDGW